MKYIILYFLFVINLYAYSNNNLKVPNFKIYKELNLSIKINKQINIIVEKKMEYKYSNTFKSIQRAIVDKGFENGIKKIILERVVSNSAQSSLKIEESYSIKINQDVIIIKSKSDLGLVHGLTTLESLILNNDGKLYYSMIFDYPRTKKRILQLSIWSSSLNDFKDIIKLARFNHYNQVLLTIPASVMLNSFKNFTLYQHSLSLSDFKLLIEFIKESGMEIIPNVQLLSHQDMFFKDAFPKYMFNHDTYDPRIKELYTKIVFPVIDELLEITKAKQFHIGHDEVYGYMSTHGVKQLPPELFLKDILILYEYLHSKNIETLIWGDMLIKSSEFPMMEDRGYYFRGNNGYSLLRNKIPKEIIICDWHYRGDQYMFPTSLTFSNNGHKVLGAVWKIQNTKINFTEYINGLENNGEGMIATTWYSLINKQKLIEEIIIDSGRIFWNGN